MADINVGQISEALNDMRTTGFKVGNENEMAQNGFCWQVSGMAA